MKSVSSNYVILTFLAAAFMAGCIDRGRPTGPQWDLSDISPDELSTTGDHVGDLPGIDGLIDVPDMSDLQHETFDALADSETYLETDSETLDIPAEQEVCTPECGDWECGDDGCGGECGECDDDLFCTGDTCIEGTCINAIIDGYCVIVEECFKAGDLEQDNECLECRPSQDKTDWSFSDDGVICEEDLICFQGSCCDASTACDGAECGDDGCGGSCGECGDPLAICFVGSCLCVPDCDDKECGEGGCGTLCGICPNPQDSCVDNACICAPKCDGKSCGPDGCGGSCGSCEDLIECTSDVCFEGACTNSVQDYFCFFGDACIPAETASPDNACQKCLPAQSQTEWTLLPPGALCGDDAVCFTGECCPRGANCQGKQCGDDGCGGSCGKCTGPQVACVDDLCLCQPACDGKNCGDDGCGGLCGACEGGQLCEAGLCKCKPEATSDCCGNDVCWFDSCGNQGEVQASCPFGCADATCANCTPACDGFDCGEDGCGGSCGTCSGFQQECMDHLCVCVPFCDGKVCGSDGCGGSCGSCPGPQDVCLAGECACKPACTDIECGADGCGGQCGTCQGPQDICDAGSCVCQPDCNNKVCGPDGCGGNCGDCDVELTCVAAGCAQGACTFAQLQGTCLINGICFEDGETNPTNPCQICAPESVQDQWSLRPDGVTCGDGAVCYGGLCCAATANCIGKECGSNGCGGSCGNCLGPQDVCANGNCLCVAACDGKECGPDGCSGTCGSCSGGKVCQGSDCNCVPEHHTDCCGGDVCWVDSCGNLGAKALTCEFGCANGECNNCTPICDLKVCGGDGCGGSCGSCLGVQDLCVAGACECQPACDGKVCGSDGCGGSCGTCNGDQDICINGACICQPACNGLACGADGCGEQCGICGGEQELCIDGACICQPDCAGKECGTDGCGGTCGSCNDDLNCTTDICGEGVCQNIRDSFYCIIEQQCYLLGEIDPAAPCNYCEPVKSPFKWSLHPDGEECGSGGICYLETCCPRTVNCAGLECGTDGCGGSCGSCSDGFFCIKQLCIDPTVCDDGNSVDWDGCTGGQVTEFKTNTYKWNEQMDPAVAVTSDGGYVIVWESKDQDGDSYGVYGQLYGADGQPKGAEFRANKFTESTELDPDVAALTGGGFVVVWDTNEDANEAGNVVVSRIFNSIGAATSDDITLPSYKSGSQDHPAVTGLVSGGFAAVWDNDGSGDSQGIFMRLFKKSGTAEGSQTIVNIETSGNQLNPDIVQLDSGNLVVVWVSKDQDGNAHGIFSRRFESSGSPLTGDMQVNNYWDGEQEEGQVVALTGGGYIVNWHRKGAEDTDGIYARRFNAQGVASGGQFLVNSTIPEKQYFPCVGALPGNGFLTAWQSENQDGSKWGIYYRRMDADDVPLAADARANIYTSDEQQSPACAGFSDGRFVIVWESNNQDGSNYGIFHQRFAEEGYRLYP